MRLHSESGFSLVELLVATGILLLISSAVTSGLLDITNSQRRISNRVDMHAGIRSATELLQQEVGQAGRVAIPGTNLKLSSPVAAGTRTVGVQQTVAGVTAANVSGLFNNELLTVDPGSDVEENVAITVDPAGKTITAPFVYDHPSANTQLMVYGGFATGIVPPQPGFVNGSTGSKLKLYGDVNGDGNMVYIEYSCDTVAHNFYRNVVAYDAANKPAVTASQVLLTNLQVNPLNVPCFSYDPVVVVGTDTYVLDVAITLTVQTQSKNAQTGLNDTETKALLNVSPRNVFNVWQLASAGLTPRIQPMPPTVTNLLP